MSRAFRWLASLGLPTCARVVSRRKTPPTFLDRTRGGVVLAKVAAKACMLAKIEHCHWQFAMAVTNRRHGRFICQYHSKDIARSATLSVHC